MVNAEEFDQSSLSSQLTDYYKRLFPFKPFCKWLLYGKDTQSYFERREFAFIAEGDVHMRYQSFDDPLKFEIELCRVCPHKLDIGAVYNHKPRYGKKFPDFAPVERELVFDIDLSDYDEIRICCSGTNVCRKCWRWMAIAVQVLDHLLKNHFGFKHRLWVFSGRRGMHCWVADACARKLTNSGRSAVAEYLSLITDDQKVVEVATKKNCVHPMVDEVYRIIICSEETAKLATEQSWVSEENLCEIVAGCDVSEVKSELQNIISDVKTVQDCRQRWDALRIRLDPYKRAELMMKETELCQAASDEARFHFRGFVLRRAYPRLDINVSTGLNHLLKSPFCVHPKTGRVAVPVMPEQISSTELDNYPRIDILLSELSDIGGTEGMKKDRKILPYRHCSLAPYVKTFEAFVDNLVEDDDSEIEEE